MANENKVNFILGDPPQQSISGPRIIFLLNKETRFVFSTKTDER